MPDSPMPLFTRFIGRPGWRYAVLGLGVLCVPLLIAGCRQAAEPVEAEDPGITHTLERGPVALTLHASTGHLTTADTLEVTLSATLDEGYSIDFPAYPEAESEPGEAGAPEGDVASSTEVSRFTPVGYDDPAPVLGDDGRITRRRIYRLEPFLDGSYIIPPLTVSYWKEVEGEDERSTLETEPLTITVTSVFGPNEEPGVQDIAGPVQLQDPIPWGRYVVMVLVAIVVLGAAWWYWFVRVVPGPPPPPPVPPHKRALEALEAIKRSGLVEQGLYKEYYIRVSDVLRHYMEEQFQLRAPERTTEEFLAEIQHNGVLGLQEQLLLREFLRHCDLVKFARAEPTPEQIRDTYTTCEQFIVDSEAAHRNARAAAEAVAAGEA